MDYTAPVASALASIRRFRAINDQIGVGSVYVLATAAVRVARNGPAFIEEVERITGVVPSVITGEEEARLSAMAFFAGIVDPDGVAGDLGGGSLEIDDIRGQVVIGEGDLSPRRGLPSRGRSGGHIGKADKIASKALEASKILDKGKKRDFYADRRHMALSAGPAAHAALAIRSA